MNEEQGSENTKTKKKRNLLEIELKCIFHHRMIILIISFWSG